ncbi:MAG: TubC N-terminal docking domain-related protein [Planctomycetota bacterium]
MIVALRLFGELRAQGICLSVTEGELTYDAPRGALTPALRHRVLCVKTDLISLFSELCPCPECASVGESRRVIRLFCASGLDADPQWEALRREFDALDEADERAAIQEEGCTAAELAALRAAKKENFS